MNIATRSPDSAIAREAAKTQSRWSGFPAQSKIQNPKSKISDAFSLIELLVVIAIIAMMASFTMPAMSSVLQANQLSRAGQQVQRFLVSARQGAQTRNRRVEVRFYSYTRPEDAGSGNVFNAMQSFLIAEDGSATPLAKLNRLTGTILFNEGAALSSLLAGLTNKTWSGTNDPQVSLPGVGTAYTARCFQFRPDGRPDAGTALSLTDKWFLTVHAARHGKGITAPPSNYITLQIDPLSGTLRTYQP